MLLSSADRRKHGEAHMPDSLPGRSLRSPAVRYQGPKQRSREGAYAGTVQPGGWHTFRINDELTPSGTRWQETSPNARG